MTTLMQQMMAGKDGMQYEATTQKNDASGTPAGPYNFGGDGTVFYLPRSNDNIVSTMITPRGGIMDVIPVFRQDPYRTDDDSMFGELQYVFDTLMTGVTEGAIENFITNQPTEECAPGPEGGMVKLCTIVNALGNYRGKTKEVGLVRAGLARDVLDGRVTTLLNASPAMSQFFGVPGNMPEQNAIIVSEMSRRLFELLLPFRRAFSREVWEGTPANNNDWRRFITGLSLHINSGNKVDAFSSSVCDSADSTVTNFDFELVTGTGRNIYEQMELAEHKNTVDNERRGLTPIDGFIVMREALWFEITKVIPARKYQEVMAVLSSMPDNARSRFIVNATDAQSDRDDMRTSMMLPLNGRMYRVLVDDGIPELNSTTSARLGLNQFSSDVYFIPMQVMGGMPATYFTYYDHENAQSMGILENISPNTFTFTSDGGQFRWNINFLNSCLNMNFQFLPRLSCKFPMCGWRITNVAYEPGLRAASPYPDSDYFENGGNTTQVAPLEFYSPWSPTTPTS